MVSGNRNRAKFFVLLLLLIVYLIRYVTFLVLPVCEVGKKYKYNIDGIFGDKTVKDGVLETTNAVITFKDTNSKIKYTDSLVIGTCKGYLIKNFAKKIVLEDGIITKSGVGKDSFNDLGFWNIFREYIGKLVLSSHSKEVASVILGFVFGMKDQIGRELYDLFKRAGIAHVVVASGFNIALLAGITGSIFFFLSKGYKKIAVLLILFPYLFIVGFEPPILRSYAMLMMAYVGWFLGRGMSGGFVGAVFVMLMIDPGLIYNLSFLLSVGATFGLVYLSDPVDKVISSVGLLRFLGPFKEELSTTLGAFIGVLPVSLFLLKNVSVWGIVVNVVVGPFVSLITVMGLLDSLMIALNIPLGGMVSVVVEIVVRLWLILVRLLVK